MWDLVPLLGIELEPPALGVQSLSPWTTRVVPVKDSEMGKRLLDILSVGS